MGEDVWEPEQTQLLTVVEWNVLRWNQETHATKTINDLLFISAWMNNVSALTPFGRKAW